MTDTTEQLREQIRQLTHERDEARQNMYVLAEHNTRLLSQRDTFARNIVQQHTTPNVEYNNGRADGELYMRELYRQIEPLKALWLSAYQMLSALSVATHGERTRVSADNALTALVNNTHKLDSGMRQLAVQFGFKLDTDALNRYTQITHDIREVVLQYTQNPSTATLNLVAKWFSEQTDGHAFLVADVFDIQSNAGRAVDEVKQFVGQYALNNKTTPRWHVIRNIARNIRDKTPAQRTALERDILNRFADKGWCDADGHDMLKYNSTAKRNAGKYVKQAIDSQN